MKVGVIVPNPVIAGGVRRAVSSIVGFLSLGAAASGDTLTIVLGVNGEPSKFSDLLDRFPNDVQLRELSFARLSGEEASRVSHMQGTLLPAAACGGDWGMVRDDICDMLDCDAWILVTTRVIVGHDVLPIIPLRPVMLFPFDFLEAYGFAHMTRAQVEGSSRSARAANTVAVSTEQTRLDAIAYMGCTDARVLKVPVEFHTDFHRCVTPIASADLDTRDYCLWITNGASHKNHARTLEALDEVALLVPDFRCVVIGHSMTTLPGEPANQRGRRPYLARRGFVPEGDYCGLLSRAGFMRHSATHDNGSYTPLEAAMHGVGTASADYPPMREVASSIGLTCEWFDPRNVQDIRRALITSWDTPSTHADQQHRLVDCGLSDVASTWYATVQPRLVSLASTT